MKRDYTATDIRRFLNNYYVLAGYRMPVKPLVEDSHYTDYCGPKIGGPVKASAYFELPALTKADLDYAIQRLSRLEKLVILGHYFRSPKVSEIDWAFWSKVSGQDFLKLEGIAIEKMADILSGGVRCYKCGYSWHKRVSDSPRCPRCHSRQWDGYNKNHLLPEESVDLSANR